MCGLGVWEAVGQPAGRQAQEVVLEEFSDCNGKY